MNTNRLPTRQSIQLPTVAPLTAPILNTRRSEGHEKTTITLLALSLAFLAGCNTTKRYLPIFYESGRKLGEDLGLILAVDGKSKNSNFLSNNICKKSSDGQITKVGFLPAEPVNDATGRLHLEI